MIIKEFRRPNSVYIENIDTGETVNAGEIMSIEMDIENSPDVNPIINISGEAVLKSQIDIGKFYKMWDDAAKNGKTYEGYMEVPFVVQKRRHKKWRINKKWLKRYGYKQINKKVYAKKFEIRSEDYYDPLGCTTLDIEFADDSWKDFRYINMMSDRRKNNGR